jgi:PAS domain S-box-containing protein
MDTKTEILHHFQTAIVIVNRTGEITFANERFSQKSGYLAAKLIGKKIKEFLVNSDFIGFYYSKPLSPEEAIQFLNTHKGEKERCLTIK